MRHGLKRTTRLLVADSGIAAGRLGGVPAPDLSSSSPSPCNPASEVLADRIEVPLPAGWIGEAGTELLKAEWAARGAFVVKGIHRGRKGEPTVAVVAREVAVT